MQHPGVQTPVRSHRDRSCALAVGKTLIGGHAGSAFHRRKRFSSRSRSERAVRRGWKMKPLVPVRLTRNEAQARNLLAQRVQRRPVFFGDMSWELSIEPLAQDSVLDFGPGDWNLHCDWAGAPFLVRLPESTADLWLRARFEEI